ncbi:MAG TPA: hypothetical protein VHT52_20415, partial [Stellaceae bacterium]|nr:hypothetical protein [Stellaceae bacterium]
SLIRRLIRKTNRDRDDGFNQMPETKSAFDTEGESEGDRYRRTDLTNEVRRSPIFAAYSIVFSRCFWPALRERFSGGRSARDVRRGRTAINGQGMLPNRHC